MRNQRQDVKWRAMIAFVVAATGFMAVGSPASAEPQGFIEDELGVGYFYGTFNQSPNIVLLVGGTVEDFCEDNPDEPFNAEPGIAPLRVFLRTDGSVDLKVNDKDQPIHLYTVDFDGAPPWIEQVCTAYADGQAAPAPFASGVADLKVRLSVISEDNVDVFNSVNGKATGVDGTEYKIRAWADLVVENGEPVGNPEDFVGFEMSQIKG